MHEFSIARSIVGIAEEEVRKADACNVSAIELDVGLLAGVDLHTLNFIWEPAVRDTVLQHAKMTIHLVPAMGFCTTCRREFEMDQMFDLCPSCNQYNTDLISGNELKIKSLTLNS